MKTGPFHAAFIAGTGRFCYSEQYYRPGTFLSAAVERMLYITENMQTFGLKSEGGTSIATERTYVPLL